MCVKEKDVLSIGDQITAETVDGEIRTGVVAAFEEHVVIIACGVYRYVIKNHLLEEQGYEVPSCKKVYKFYK